MIWRTPGRGRRVAEPGRRFWRGAVAPDAPAPASPALLIPVLQGRPRERMASWRHLLPEVSPASLPVTPRASSPWPWTACSADSPSAPSSATPGPQRTAVPVRACSRPLRSFSGRSNAVALRAWGAPVTSTLLVALCRLCPACRVVPGSAPGLENHSTPLFQFLGRTFSSRPLSRTPRECPCPAWRFLGGPSASAPQQYQRPDRTRRPGRCREQPPYLAAWCGSTGSPCSGPISGPSGGGCSRQR